MQDSTLESYEEHMRSGRHHQAHQLGKTTHSTYLFHLSGCKFLLHKLLEIPIMSDDPADFDFVRKDLVSAYKEHGRQRSVELLFGAQKNTRRARNA